MVAPNSTLSYLEGLPANKAAEEMKNHEKLMHAQIGAGMSNKASRETFSVINEIGQDITFLEEKIKLSNTVYFKGNRNCSFHIQAPSTKIFVEDCQNCKFHFNDKVITETIELWKSNNTQFFIDTVIQTLQIDLCTDVKIEYKNRSLFKLETARLVWAGTQNLSLSLMDNDQPLHLYTGMKEMQNEWIMSNTDQMIIRLKKSKKGDTEELINEKVVRLVNGFPSTQKEVDDFDRRQEANLEKLAQNLMPGIKIGKKKTEADKVGRNEPCHCGSKKKAKKCCQTG